MRRTMSQLRSALKRAYLAIPGKKRLFLFLRTLWIPPRRIYRHLYFRGPFEIRHEDLSFVMNHYGFGIETDIFWSGLIGQWERSSLSAWTELCKMSNVILDVGANTGIYSLVAKAANPTAHVYAFEPVRRVFEKVSANNSLNGFDIDCRQAAISNYDGEGYIYDLPVEHIYAVTLNQNLHPAGTATSKTLVKTMRLDTLISSEALQHVDLIKIDVESHEPEVLQGLGTHLHRMRPTLLVEVWNDQVGKHIEEIVRDTGYLFFVTDEQTEFRVATHIRNPQPAKGYLNYLLCTPDVAERINLIASSQ
jgi:FkbM family methyltransferase